MGRDFQILLLPRNDYWSWLQACQEYVRTFGANLTPEPSVAGGYMRPRQVVSFPNFEGAFPEIGDPVRWFRTNFDGVRLDPIQADDPVELRKDLRRRIEDNDRYGARQRPFYLVWPTDFAVVTQAFGANPQVYRRYGMPGHEGLDFRALTNTNVYACADGEVYEIGTWKNHAYGYHVRIQHRDGYKTVYAHLAKILVRKGEPVRAGQRIGLADSTGNSSGAHLHLSLKQDGATARNETVYPKDIIDPTPYLVWPAGSSSKAGPGPVSYPKVGLNLALEEDVSDGALRVLSGMRAEAVLVRSSTPGEAVERIRRAVPGIRVLVRILEPATPLAARYVSRIAGDVGRLYRLGVRDFEIAAFANEHQAGFGTAWKDGQAFAEWFGGAVDRLREIFPEIKVGFPTLASGDRVDGRQAGLEEFLLEAEAGLSKADWIGVAILLGVSGIAGPEAITFLTTHYPEKPIVVTGADDPEEGRDPERRAIAFRSFVDGSRSWKGTALFGGLHGGRPLAVGSWEAVRILGERQGTVA